MNNDGSIQEPILNNNHNENEQQNIIPTKWKVKHCCCCCGPFVELYIPHSKKKRYFLRGWEFKSLMPAIIVALLLFVTTAHFVCFFPYQYFPAQVILSIFIFIFFVLTNWAYFATVCMDPGFLPYNWAETKKFHYTWQEQLSGLAVTEQQFDFALTKGNRPPKCSFSHSAGRFIIRADHICGWTANWIGKRNHKQFILMNLYGGLFCATLATGPFFVKNFFSLPLKFLFTGILAFSIDVSFGFSLLAVFGTTLRDLAKNRTKLHRMRDEVNDTSQLNRRLDLNETFYERKITMKASMQEVCGNSSFFSWMIPLPAFDNSLIIEDDPDEVYTPFDECNVNLPKNEDLNQDYQFDQSKNENNNNNTNDDGGNLAVDL